MATFWISVRIQFIVTVLFYTSLTVINLYSTVNSRRRAEKLRRRRANQLSDAAAAAGTYQTADCACFRSHFRDSDRPSSANLTAVVPDRNRLLLLELGLHRAQS